MADVNANIGVNIDTSDALNQLKNLQRQISQFHQSVAKSSSAAAVAQRDLQKNFINGVNAIQGFSAELRTVRTSAESFTNSLEKNKFSIQQYFRYAASQTKTFGKNFTSEFATIEKTAIERVKTLQTQYIKMGRDANGAMQAIAIRPTILNMKDLGTQTAIAAQKQVLFNQLVKQGSTNLLNFGKNTQWAGRQLMVGFTLPLATLGMTAGRVFMDMEKAALKFKKVYGDLFTAPGETEKALESIVDLGIEYTKYGVAVSESLDVAAEAAAAGFQGVDLQNQTTASLKLSVLGQMDLQKALETTIALQNAFRISSADLAGEIDFLNAVENQTVVSLGDITEAVPRVAPVIQALGGDVRDLAFFLAAMKEGGVNAAQGANALKSGLASLINPTERASQLLAGMGINIRQIVSQNQGDLRGTVIGFARALDTLDPMRRAQAIEQLFGKFQFARISALFDNVIKDGSQASRVLDLAGSSLEELATLSEKELGVSAASAMNKFRASIEQVKVALAPLGELFLEIATPFIDFATTVLKAFNNLPDGMKRILGTVITVIGGLGPVLLMTFGLINNGIANMIKFFATVRLGYLKMTGQAKGIGDETQYMTQEQLEAAAAASSLDQAHAGLTQRFTAEKVAVDALRAAYEQAAAAGARFATLNPGMMKPGSVAAPMKMAKGGIVTVGGRGNKDTEPALLTPGEAVIPAEMVKKYQPLIQGMIAGNIPGYQFGTAAVGSRGSVTFNSQSYDTRGGSESRIASLINQMIEYGSGVEEVTRMLDGLKDSGDLTIKTLEETAKANDKIKTVNPNKSERLVQAHLQTVKQSDINPVTGERTMGSFTRRMLETQNSRLKKGQDVEEFSKQYKSVTGGLNEAIQLGGLELTESVKKTAQDIDDQIHDMAIKLANGGKVTDKILEDASNAVLDTAEKAGGEMAKVAQSLKKVRDDLEFKVIAAPTSETRKQVGIQRPDESEMAATLRLESEGKLVRDGRTFKTTEAGKYLSSTAEFARLSSDGGFATKQRVPAIPGSKTYLDSSKKTDPASLAKVGVSINKDIRDEVGDSLLKASASASPSEKTIQASNNMVQGVTETLVNSKDDVARATETMVSPVTQKRTGPRRASTDPAVMAALAGNQAVVEASRGPRRASAPEGPPTPRRPGEPGFIGPLPQEPRVASNFMNNLSKASLALSSVTGILYMFGNDLGGIIPVISGVSAAIFGLISVSQALQGTFIATAAAARATAVANSLGAASLGQLFVGGKGLAGLFTNIGTALKVGLRFLGPIGIALSLLAVAIPFVINLYQKQRDKMEAFGKIIDVTADQIKFLGQQAGESVTTTSGFERATLGQAETATDAANQKAADEQFLEQFKTQIAATKAGALGTVNEALEILAFKLSSAGLSDQVVNSTIAGIIQASKRTDLEFDFSRVGLSPANTAGLLTDLRSRIATATEVQQTEGYQAAYSRGPAPQSTQELKDVGANVAGIMEGLATQLEARIITIEEYSAAFNELKLSLIGLEGTAKETAIDEAINKIFPEDKEMANAIKGVEDLEQQMLLLELAGVGGSDSMQEFVDKTKDGTTSKAQYVTLIKKEIAAQKQLNDVKDLEVISEEQISEADALRDKIAVYDELVAAGLTAAEAYRIAGDAALTEGYKTALAAGDLQLWIDGVNEIANLTAQFESRRPTGGSGGQKSPFQEAIDSLKEQQKEAKNSIMAYAKLRSAGLSVAESSKIAGDSMLAAALASQQVGSKKWNELVTAIRAARAEEEAWLSSTPEGRAEQFAEVYSKVMDVFSAQEAVLEMNNEAATAANRKIIETLEKQIDAYQRRSSELERDLDKIAEKENEINKAYDEKNKALEKVKKLNQDIINQQKSQLSIADALSRGDISAAASAMQDARAQSAAAQGDAMGTALDASRQSQLNALTQNGKTRVQIEAEIKQIKKDVEVIEFGALQNARDAVKAADEALETAKESLTVQGQTKTEWENINTRIDASKANAALYDAEVAKALENAKGLVGEWSKLEDTFTTTHVINTVHTSNGAGVASTTAATTTPGALGSHMGGFYPGQFTYQAKGGMIKPSYFNAGGFAKGTDTVPAMLTPGEFVVNKASTKRFGPLLEAMNSKSFRYSAMSGSTIAKDFSKPVYNIPERNYSEFGGNVGVYSTSNNSPSLTALDNSVYNNNYSLSVNVGGTDASANDIANVVINKIKAIDSQQVRRQVLR